MHEASREVLKNRVNQIHEIVRQNTEVLDQLQKEVRKTESMIHEMKSLSTKLMEDINS